MWKPKNMAYLSLNKIKELPFVDYISDERSGGDGIWVYLKKGFFNPHLETHCIHEDLISKIQWQLKIIKECTCKECKLYNSKLNTHSENKNEEYKNAQIGYASN